MGAYFSTSYSTNGKIVNVYKNTVPSTMTSTRSVQTYYDEHGYPYYKTTYITNGNDDKGRYFWDSVSDINQFKLRGSSFSFNSKTGIKYVPTWRETINGSINSMIKFRGYSIYTVNTNKGYTLSKRVTTLHFLKNGANYAKSTIVEIPYYKYFYGRYIPTTWKQSMQTVYANGDLRNSIINTIFIRNSYGISTGLKINGISTGKENVNNKWVTYKGNIIISSRKGNSDGNYREYKTSTSSKLIKRLPLESIFNDLVIQQRNSYNIVVVRN